MASGTTGIGKFKKNQKFVRQNIHGLYCSIKPGHILNGDVPKTEVLIFGGVQCR